MPKLEAKMTVDYLLPSIAPFPFPLSLQYDMIAFLPLTTVP